MSESILTALIRLFALIIDLPREKHLTDREIGIVRSFLSRQLNKPLTEKYMDLFNEYLEMYHKVDYQKDSKKDRKRTSLTSMRILGICEEINRELQQKQKTYVIIQLIEFISFGEEITDKELDFLETVASAFNLDREEFSSIRNFIINDDGSGSHRERLLIIDAEDAYEDPEIKHLTRKNLSGRIWLLYIPSTGFILRYMGDDDLYLNSQHVSQGITYAFEHGSSLRSQGTGPVYYSDLTAHFTVTGQEARINITADRVQFRFPSSAGGIRDFSFSEESGNLVGIMGGSGVGKSTLLNVLNGNLKPQSGKVCINGFDVYDDRESEHLRGVIGYVPQDDLLIEELTVFQNLYYNARLCLSDFSDQLLRARVKGVLEDLDLDEISDLKVGNPLKKVISGGQRKRVNIALELIREPSILFVDEPTSGLSSVDSESVMNLLKEQTGKGKLVIVNIHQPSSDLYKMFDKIIILDRGGYQVYYGNPTEAIVYFKTHSHHVNPDEDQCSSCGNVNPDQVLQIIEARVVNEHGRLTRTRKVSPREWYELFLEKIRKKQFFTTNREAIPENLYSIPGKLKQAAIFFSRDLISKLANRQYVLLILLEAPILALILGFLTRYSRELTHGAGEYVFSSNENLPAYLFMSVVVALFLGLMISSEEIIHDRKILQRERFLNLSRFSYISSKVVIMLVISMIQTLTYVLIGNMLLDIKGMTLSYWLVLFSAAVFSNMLGLNISSGFNSVVTVYVMIPFLLIPQLLLGGVIIRFDKLHKSMASKEYVPVIGDLMASRWAYEALSVEQFKDNVYEAYFFPLDRQISKAEYHATYLLPALNNSLTSVEFNMGSEKNKAQTKKHIRLINTHINELRTSGVPVLADGPGELKYTGLTVEKLSRTRKYLDASATYFRKLKSEGMNKRDERTRELIEELGGRFAFVDLKQEYQNTSLADLVMANKEFDKIQVTQNRIIRRYQPIYKAPVSRAGRAHFYAPEKRIGNLVIDTLWFNVMAIWLMSIVLYFTLYFNILKSSVQLFERVRFRFKRDVLNNKT